jgi:tyrosinase
LADYSGKKYGGEAADITDEMPIMGLGDKSPVVKDYMDIQAGPLCYTYSDI